MSGGDGPPPVFDGDDFPYWKIRMEAYLEISLTARVTMSGGDGPPPVFDGDDFPYWKIRMEAYLEAIDMGVYKAATQGFPAPIDPTNLVGDEFNYEKWNAKAKNTLFRGLCKDVFNRVRNHKNAHDLWMDICALHEGTRSEREERYHIAMRKLNSFEMLANENASLTARVTMSGGDGPPPVFDGDDFPYWKIRMEAYLEAIDIGVYKAATQGFPEPRDPKNLVGEEFNYENWNAKAKNTLLEAFAKMCLS